MYAIVDNLGAQNEYIVIQTQATHGGESFGLLVDSGSTLSFLSPRCLRKLKLDQFNTRPMIVETANKKEVLSKTTVGHVNFELRGRSTSMYFRVFSIGVYNGILRMGTSSHLSEQISIVPKVLFLF